MFKKRINSTSVEFRSSRKRWMGIYALVLLSSHLACRPAIDDNAPDPASDSSSSTTVTDASITPEKLSKAYLPLGGGTMTGALVLAADPSAAMQAATKQYVDAQVASASSSAAAGNLPLAGGTMTGAITLAGAPTVANHASTKTYVDSSVAIAAPTGAIFIWATSTAPTGWLLCDGTAVSRTTYAALFAVLGVTHGSGDGATTFNLPDYRGRFLRGVDGGIARDPDRATRTAMNAGGNTGDNVGSVQTDGFQGHFHTESAPNTGYYTISYAGGIQTDLQVGSRNISSSSPTNDGTNGVPRTTSETRPTNAGVNYIIKY